MDLKTENRIAALLMKEAVELHRQVQSEALDMQEMRSCYDNLLFAAAATANSAYVVPNEYYCHLYRQSLVRLQEETMLVGGLLSILQLSMGKATVGDASNCRNKPDKASVFMLQADCWKITLLGDEFRSRNMGP
ncbi:hypothetical protein OROHE_012884 [Orobanche hederae]